MLPVVLLLGLIAGGVYNYQRNLQAEAAVPRPYETYAQEDLEALLDAYEAENARIERQYEAARERLGRERQAGLLDQNIQAFEQAQRDASTSREIGIQLSMRMSATEEIEAELARREQEADRLRVHLKRLLTI